MRKLLLFILSITIFFTANATNYFMSPTGNNNNPGTIGSPWLTLVKANNTLVAGDTLFLLPGTFLSPSVNGASIHFLIQNLTGTASHPIVIMNYQNGLVQFSCTNIIPTNQNPFAMAAVNCNYVKFKGFTIKMMRQIDDGSGVSRGFKFEQSNDCTFEKIHIFCIGGTGFTLDHSNRNLIINCDSNNNGDARSPDAFNFGDGFTDTGNDPSTDNVFDSCRTWMNGDDGWDFFQWGGNKVTIQNCLSYFQSVKPWGINGTQPDEFNMTPLDTSVFYNRQSYYTTTLGSSGESFKLGGCNDPGCPSPAPNTTKKFLYNNIGFMSNGTGFSANMAAQFSHRMLLENCVAYANNNDGFGFGTGRSVGIAMIFKNDWGWLNNRVASTAGGDFEYDGLPDSISNNVWMTVGNLNYGNLKPPVNVSAIDFISTDFTTAIAPRNADGTLPASNFMKLVPASDLVNAGVNIGRPFCGSAPDVNVFELCTLPTVNIGSDLVITLPTNSVSFTPTVSGASSLLWSQYSGTAGTIVPNVTTQNITFGNLNTAGVRGIRLCVTNNSGTVCDSATVTVNAAAAVNPSCSAGSSPVTITLPTSSVALTATGSSNSGNTVSFAWTQYLGTTVTINNANTANATAVGLTAGTYGFQVTVTDNGNALTCQSTKTVNVNAVPVTPTANAGSNQTITLPTNSVSLTGSGSGGTINSYLWTVIQGIGGSLSAPTSANTNLTGLVAGIYLVQLRVGNTDGNFGRDTVQITVNNAATAPTCSAGVTPVGITLPVNSVGLAATGTSTAGNTVSFLWSKLSGTGSSITTPASQITTATGLTAGSYVYRVTVTDNVNGLTCTSDKTVTVNAAPNVSPVVTVSPKTQTISLPTTTASVSGTVIISSGTLAGVLWQKLAGSPAGGTITSASSTSTTITALQVGTYRYSLTATDSNLLTGADTLTIIVSAVTTGNGLRYLQASTNGATINLGWSFDYIKYPTARYMVAQERINNVFTDLQPRILPTTKTQDYWYFIDKKKGTYYFRIAQYDTGGAVYYSPMVTVVKKK